MSDGEQPAANSPVQPVPPAGEPNIPPIQFGLDSLLLATALVAAICGAFVVTPLLGVLACVVAASTLVRTLVLRQNVLLEGGQFGLAEKVVAFLASGGIVLLVLMASVTAFVAVIMLVWGLTGEPPIGVGVGAAWINPLPCGIGVLGGLGTLAYLSWLTWPRRSQ
jgi:hypothetical protein